AAFSLGGLAPTDVPYPTWTSYAIQDFQDSNQTRRQIVFLGSSLLVNPIGAVDADEKGANVDATRHHRSLYFEKQLKALIGRNISTYNFALPGAMPSDAYLITRFLLKGKKCPDLIIYGVAPRDLLENTLPNPSATDPFRYLSRLGDYSNKIDLIAPDFLTRLNYEISRVCYPYGSREDIKTSSIRISNKLLEKVFPSSKDDSYSIHKRKQILPEYHPYEIQEKEAFFKPSQDADLKFADNSQEYRFRYKHFKKDTFKSQLEFLHDTLAIAKARKIHCVLVAMPITRMNRDLIKSESWAAYKSGVEKVSTETGATFIDMQASDYFSKEDFADGVHLHSRGGKKFLALLAQSLADNTQVVQALADGANRQSVAALEESRL
ncbi:MAG: DUF1574 domain-containing protein, partial [Candidatus Obscuribacterales bacterium]|nr:DUF1574 domain-containing protein [Candidatus Obscuribacterales bacterium]